MTSSFLALTLFVMSAAPSRVPAAASRYEAPADPAFRIGPEDIVQISVWNNEAMSRTAPIRPDGKISIPLLNDV
ncbi:MAG TPA: polysaccharide biosynthesis/export family protein [Vicinamibacteria bacterium]